MMDEKINDVLNNKTEIEEEMNPSPEDLPQVDFNTVPIDQWRHLSAAHRMCSEMLRKSSGLEDISQPALLAALARNPNGVADSQKILAEMLHVTPATVTVSLRAMQRNGYVTKQVSDMDQRRKRITLTEKGKKASGLLKGFTDMLDNDMYKGFTEEEKALCSDFFERMTKNLEDSAQNLRRIILRRQRYAAAQAERAAEAAEIATREKRQQEEE